MAWVETRELSWLPAHLLKACLTKDPRRRPTLQEINDHPWFHEDENLSVI